MDENNAWNNFQQSGKISDYLKYTQSKPEQTTVSKVGADATQDTGNYPQTT
ncbi:MAG: hypothetical protein WAX04_11180 [Oscillospiraceae bacterium]